MSANDCPFCGDCESCRRTLRNEDKLTKAEKRVAELETALRPFAEYAASCRLLQPEGVLMEDEADGVVRRVTAGDVFHAADVLAKGNS